MPPAARVTDMHTCPMFTGPVPHVGGSILPPGAPTVLIDFLPAATVTSMVTCVGPLDMIVKGSTGVFINFLPAARMGDLTAHGGVIVLGSPTCLIGEIGAPSPGAGGLGGIVAGLILAGLSDPIDPNASVYAEPGSHGATGASPASVTKKATKGGSTTVTVDDTKKTVTIATSMEFCGPDATEAYAAAAKKQIEDAWSGTMQRNGASYQVKTSITTSVDKTCGTTQGTDQIIVDSKTNRMSQTLYGAGPGYQTPAAATDTARPRRIAHEYGHTLGLDTTISTRQQGQCQKIPPEPTTLCRRRGPTAMACCRIQIRDTSTTSLRNMAFSMNPGLDRRTFVWNSTVLSLSGLRYGKGLWSMGKEESNATMDALTHQLAQEQSAFFLRPFSFSWWLRGGEPGSPSDNLTLEGDRGTIKAAYIRVRFDSTAPSHSRAETFTGVVHRDRAIAILGQLFEGPLFRNALPEENEGAMQDGRKESWLFRRSETHCEKTLHEPFPAKIEALRILCEKTVEELMRVYVAHPPH